MRKRLARLSESSRTASCAALGRGLKSEFLHVVMDLDGTNRREITSGAQHYTPHWSPDGRWLLFTGAPLGATQFDLLRVRDTGGVVVEVVATEADERTGSWMH